MGTIISIDRNGAFFDELLRRSNCLFVAVETSGNVKTLGCLGQSGGKQYQHDFSHRRVTKQRRRQIIATISRAGMAAVKRWA